MAETEVELAAVLPLAVVEDDVAVPVALPEVVSWLPGVELVMSMGSWPPPPGPEKAWTCRDKSGAR